MFATRAAVLIGRVPDIVRTVKTCRDHHAEEHRGAFGECFLGIRSFVIGCAGGNNGGTFAAHRACIRHSGKRPHAFSFVHIDQCDTGTVAVLLDDIQRMIVGQE
jgi:hypothetical protein